LKQIFDYFDQIHAAQGRKNKLALIAELVAIDELRPVLTEVLQHTYDPYTTFGVIVKDTKTTSSLFDIIEDDDLPAHWEETKRVLKKLADRELTGNAAKSAIAELLDPLPARYRARWVQIINRDLKIAGIAASTWAIHIDGLMNNINPQLCEVFDNRTIQEPMFVEPKYDGIRATFVPNSEGKIAALSREGKPINNTQHIAAELMKVYGDNMVFDGELFYQDFHTTQSITRTQTDHPLADKLQFFAFDVIPLSEWNEQKGVLPLFQRKQILRALIDRINGTTRPPKPTPEELKARIETAMKNHVVGVEIPAPKDEPDEDDSMFRIRYVPNKIIGNNRAADAFYQKCVAAGFEGIIFKEYGTPYQFRRNKVWMKMKPLADADLTIVGAYEGEDRLVGSLGGITVEGTVTFNSRPYKIKSNVGGGFTDVQRRQLWEEYQRGDLVGRIVQVTFQEPDTEGALRFPVFERLRDDRAETSA